jgi:hypothetical protein
MACLAWIILSWKTQSVLVVSYRRSIQCTICGGVGFWTVLTLLKVVTGLTVDRIDEFAPNGA